MAVLAGTPQDAGIHGRAAAHQLACVEEIRLVKGGIGVALLAEERTRHLQQFVMVRAVRVVAVHAVVPHRCMFPKEWAAFFGVTLVTGFVDRIILEQGIGCGPVRVVAIHTSHFALEERHVGTLGKLGALLLVAREASLVDARLLKQAGGGEFRHWVVAIAAAKIVGGMGRTRPEHALAPSVAG